jgi:hypothetical protein
MKKSSHQKQPAERDKHCHHPTLKEAGKGEKICSVCSRTIYSARLLNDQDMQNDSSGK